MAILNPKSPSYNQEKNRIRKAFEPEFKEKDDKIEALEGDILVLKEELYKKEERRITINRQLLILHYSGILDSLDFKTNEDKYYFFHLLIDKNKQAVKDFFESIN